MAENRAWFANIHILKSYVLIFCGPKTKVHKTLINRVVTGSET